jgi:hypothetical protein
MGILNNSEEIQSLFDRAFDLIKENNEEQILEFITMMIKAKRNQEIIEYLINHDHIEYVSFFLFFYYFYFYFFLKNCSCFGYFIWKYKSNS